MHVVMIVRVRISIAIYCEQKFHKNSSVRLVYSKNSTQLFEKSVKLAIKVTDIKKNLREHVFA